MSNFEAVSTANLRLRDREKAWRWASTICDGETSVWRMELVKTLVVKAEEQPGCLENLPLETGMKRLSLAAWWRGAKMVSAAIAAFACLCAWMLKFGCNDKPKFAAPKRLAALHGEWSTRTRHLLRAVEHAEPPLDAIILVGRLKTGPKRVRKLWRDNGADRAADLPMIVPVSFAAFVGVLPGIVRMVGQGTKEAVRFHPPVSFAEYSAIAFRVMLGSVNAYWWEMNASTESCEVWFGQTGAAETTLLERRLQRSGAFTVHAVHGQAVGPNFLGISNLALFRSVHDANAYAEAGCYRRCAIQPAGHLSPKIRGEEGVLLLTNLVHPINASFRVKGPVDEIQLLNCVAAVADRLGETAQPRLWKPHPAIERVSPCSAAKVRHVASELGFSELDDLEAKTAANRCRYVVCTPSTVALDLLVSGILCVVADPQGTITDTALSSLPVTTAIPDEMAHLLLHLDNDDEYELAWQSAFLTVGPARELDLTTQLI